MIRYALLVIAACGCDGSVAVSDGSAPDLALGPDFARIPFCEDGADGGPAATLASVERLLVASCAISGCHDRNATPTAGSLDLSAGQVYASLVNVAAHEKCGGTRVIPGDAASSYLMHKLTDATPCEGLGMPRCEDGSCPLRMCAIEVVRAWIAAGAPK